MCSSHKGQPLVAIRRMSLVTPSGGSEIDALVRETYIKIRVELDRLGSAPFEAAPPITSMARQTLPEHFHKQLRVG